MTEEKEDMVTPPEEQKQRESDAVAKEHAALRKSSEKFAELTRHMDIRGSADDELKQTVRLLVMAEQTDALTAVLTRLNGDRKSWEMAQREPVALVAMIIEEQQKRMEQLQKKLTEVTEARDAFGTTSSTPQQAH